MSSHFNQVILLANTCRDVELSYTPKGTAVGNFSVAVNRKWKNESGDLMEEVTFLDCVAFGRTAETLAQYVKKGHAVHLVGRLKQDVWDDKTTGQKRSKIKVIVESFTFLNQRDGAQTTDTGNPPQARQQRPAARRAAPAQDDANQLPQDDNVPF